MVGLCEDKGPAPIGPNTAQLPQVQKELSEVNTEVIGKINNALKAFALTVTDKDKDWTRVNGAIDTQIREQKAKVDKDPRVEGERSKLATLNASKKDFDLIMGEWKQVGDVKKLLDSGDSTKAGTLLAKLKQKDTEEKKQPAVEGEARGPGGAPQSSTGGVLDSLDTASRVLDKATGVAVRGAAAGIGARAFGQAWGGGGGAVGIGVGDNLGNVGVGLGPYGAGAGVGSFGGGFGIGGGFGGGAFAGMDFSNTGFSIGFNAMNNRDKARALDVILNMLLASIMSGNLDAITTALTMVNLKSKTTLIEASVHMIQAMRYYDKQSKETSDKIAAVVGKPSQDGGATIAQYNNEMNQYSMTRQAITNGVRDVMTMIEELSNAEQGFRTKREHIASSATRWA